MSETEATNRSAERSPAVALAQWLLMVAAVFAAVAAGMSFLSQTVGISALEGSMAPEPTSEYPSPDFRLASLDGGQLGPPDFAGQVVLIDFWATWCSPCRLQARYIEELHRELASNGVTFLAVSVGEDEATVRGYVEKTPFPYPVLFDPEDSMSVRYQLLGLPTVMIVDRRGEISYLQTGLSDTDTLRQELRAAGAEV